jgi:membrane-bound lytic murein transglycosylase D
MNLKNISNSFIKIILSFLCLATISLIWMIFTCSKNISSNTDLDYQKYFNKNYKIFSLNIPEKLDFAGEELPLNDIDIRERIDREILINTYWQSQSLLFHKKANRWFPIIEPILKANNVPDDFKYLCLVESGLENVISPKGATGFWQFLEETGKSYGLEINDMVDERYHVEKSTAAACKYFKEAYKRYGNWTLAAASYNMGMGGIDKQIDRQKQNSYYNLLLNQETARYVFRIVAAKEIISNASNYGFYFRKKDLYPPYETYTVKVDSSITNFADFASKYETNYKIVKLLNPWLRDSMLDNKTNKMYTIKLPKKGFDQYFNLENDTIAIIDTSIINTNDTIQIDSTNK